MKISQVIEEEEDWDGLARWLGIVTVDTNKIRTYCIFMEINVLTLCCRKKLVEIYCYQTDKSPQQVAEDMARVLEDKMENRAVARKLRELTFGEKQITKGGKKMTQSL